MQSSEFIRCLDQPNQQILFLHLNLMMKMWLSLCFQTDCKGSGRAAAYSRYFLDLWRPCCQHTLLGIPVHFCCIQFITSKLISAGLFQIIYETKSTKV